MGRPDGPGGHAAADHDKVHRGDVRTIGAAGRERPSSKDWRPASRPAKRMRKMLQLDQDRDARMGKVIQGRPEIQGERFRATSADASPRLETVRVFKRMAREEHVPDPRPNPFYAPFSRSSIASAWTCLGKCRVSMPDEVGPPEGVSTPKRSASKSASSASSQDGKSSVRTSRKARARVCAADCDRGGVRGLARARSPTSPRARPTRWPASDRITPIRRSDIDPLAREVAPVVVTVDE